MRRLLVLLIGIILVMLLAIWKLDFFSSIFPGWNSMLNTDDKYYLVVFVLNIFIPVFLYLVLRRIINLYIFIFYFLIVNAICTISGLLVYDDITPGMTNQNFKNYMFTQKVLMYSLLLIHLIFYVFTYFKTTNRTNKGFS